MHRVVDHRLSRRKRLTIAALLAVAILVPIGAAIPFWPFTLPTSVHSSAGGPIDHVPGFATTGVIYSWRGLLMRPAPATSRLASAGMLVEEVAPKSPAARTKLKPGDVITAFDGLPVNTARNLAFAVADHCCGPTVALSVWREHHPQRIQLPPSTPLSTAMLAAKVRLSGPIPTHS